MDKLRRRKRHLYQTLQPQEAGEAMETAKRSIHASQTPKATLIQHEACEWIEQCLYRLPVPLLSVMILIDLEYFDYTEAANILGIPLGTVKSRLGQARMRMAQILREEKKPEAQDNDRVEKGGGKQRHQRDVGRDTCGIHGGKVDKAAEF